MRWLLLMAWIVLLPLSASLPAHGADEEDGADRPPTIYKWVDENGIGHYTTDRDRIPRGLRDRFDRPAARSPRTAAPEAAPPAPFEVPAPEAAEAGLPAPEPLEPTAPMATGPRPPIPVESGPTPPSPMATAPSLPPAPSLPLETARPVVEGPSNEAWSQLDLDAVPPPAPEPAEGVAERDLRAQGDFAGAEAPAAAELDARIAFLEEEIRADEEALMALLAAPEGEAPLAVADDADLRAIAERLPDRLAELDSLRGQRGTP